jgi:TonB-linked SusC/RagA family outer membrane protein
MKKNLQNTGTYLPRSLWKACFPFLLIIALPVALIAQQRTLNGRVTSAIDKLPIPGVNIFEKGTSNGTVTDSDGKYQISVNENTVLVFSQIGSKTVEITVGSQTEINIEMEESATSLDEVVVTGSTLRQAKREIGNHISTVKAESLARSGSSDLFSSLQGKVPGAQITQNSGDPAGGISIRLRGVKSLQGASDPLYVIDGVIVSNSTVNVSQTALGNQVGQATLGTNRMVDINPADIESLNVINGAAAAAQYGSRAANGVVLITTKKGKQGTPRFNFTTSINLNELRKKVPITTYGKQFGFANLRLHPIGALSVAQFNSIGTGAVGAYVPQPGETFASIVRDGVQSYLRTNQVDVTRYDYQDHIFQTGIGTDNNLSLTGGNDKTQYFAALSYTKNEGIIRGTDFTRYNFRVRVDQRLADWAKLSAGVSYANSFSNEKANGNVFYSPINSVNITNNIYDITQRDAAGKLLAVEPTRVNPLSTIEDMNFTQGVNRTISDLQLNLSPAKGLGVDLVMGVDGFNQVGRGLIEPYPYQAQAGLPPERYPNGFASHATNTQIQYNTDLNVTYERQLSHDFKLNLVTGLSYQYFKSEFTRTSGESLAPFIETINGAASTTVTSGYFLDQFYLFGYFAQATVGYKNLAFITAAVRQDESSKFSANERRQFYPKVSGSFVVSDLGWWQNTVGDNWLNSFKLRTSWGEAGNLTGIDSYARFWQFNPTPFLGRSTIVPGSQLANPSVRPERMSEIEVGGDMTFWSDRISLGVTYYQQKISDLVVNRNVASSTGGLSIVTNVGQMENKGVEIMLGVSPVKTSNFSWDISLIYNRNRNRVTKLGTPTIGFNNAAVAPSFLVEGMPASVFYGTAFARDANGNILLSPTPNGFLGGLPQQERGTQLSTAPTEFTPGRDGSGQPSGSVIRKIIGDPNPDFTGAFTSTFSYKRLSFNFLLDIVQGADVFNADKRTRQNVGIGENVEKELKGELPRGYTFAVLPIEEWRIDDGSYVKLREIGLTYVFDKPIKGINTLTLGAFGRNLFSWDNYNGYDPETNAGGNNDLIRGIDFGNVPIPRSYKFQLTVSF